MHTIADIAIVGAGPAGLSASIYAASEGFSVLTIEHKRVGGQSASSSLIENYYGFPKGISGAELAERGRQQALKLGATIITEDVDRLIRTSPYTLHMADGEVYQAHSVVIASGLAYRKLGVPGDNCPDVHYGAAMEDYAKYQSRSAVVVGGGNSAGQAAQALAEHDCDVVVIVRGKDLTTMSAYLTNRVLTNPKVEVAYGEKVKGFRVEDGTLHAVDTNTTVYPAAAAFIFVGMVPDTNWCKDCVEIDGHGFVLIDHEFHTTAPGVFAIGDVHSGARGRIGAAVGEGSMVIPHIQKWLDTQKEVLSA